MTLPIWRDKLAAEIAQAKANELAAKSRLKAAQIDLAVSFAEKSFAYRETSRNLALIEDELVPKARQSLEIVRAGYRADTMDFSSMTDAERMLLDLQLEAAEARTEREIRSGGPVPHGRRRATGQRAAFVECTSTLKFYELEIETDFSRNTAPRGNWFGHVHRRLLASTELRPIPQPLHRRKRFTPAGCTRGLFRIIPAIARFAA